MGRFLTVERRSDGRAQIRTTDHATQELALRHPAPQVFAPDAGRNGKLTRRAHYKCRKIKDTWQTDAANLVRRIGEVLDIVSLTADSVSRCDLTPHGPLPDGKIGPVVDDPRVANVDSALRGPGGSMAPLLRRAAEELEVSGEGTLIVEPATPVGADEPTDPVDGRLPVGEDGAVVATIASIWELQEEKGRHFIRTSDPKNRRFVHEDARMARFHRPDFQYADSAISAIQGALEPMQQVALLDDLISIVAASELSNGVVFIPDGASVIRDSTPVDPDGDAPAEQTERTVADEIYEAAQEAGEDPTSIHTVAPLVVEIATDAIEKVRFLTFNREISLKDLRELREDTIGRVYAALNIPKDHVNKGQAKYANGENLDAERLDHHIRPILDVLAGFFTEAWLQPMLVAYEQMTPEEASQYFYVGNDLAIRPVDAEAVLAQHAAGLITRDEARGLLGYEPDPTESDAAADALRSLSPLVVNRILDDPRYTTPVIDALLGGIEPDTSTPALPEPAPPLDASTTPDVLLASQIVAAVNAALPFVLQRAGGRLVTAVRNRGTQDLLSRLRALDKQVAWQSITDGELAAAGVTQSDLFPPDTWGTVLHLVDEMTRDTFTRGGLPGESARRSREIVERLAVELDRMVASLRTESPAMVTVDRVRTVVIGSEVPALVAA